MDQKPTPGHLEISGELSIYTAATLRRQLLDALDAAPQLEVDLAGVTEMDSAGVQLMVAAKREATMRNKLVQFTAHSQVVVDVLELLDLSAHLGDPVLITERAKETT